MGTYKTDTEALYLACDKLLQTIGELNRASDMVRKAQISQANMEDTVMVSFRDVISSASVEIDRNRENLATLRNLVLGISDGVLEAEKKACQMLELSYELPEDMMAENSWHPDEGIENELFTMDNAQKIIQAAVGKCSFSGAVVSAVWKAEDGSDSFNNLKQANKIVGTTAKTIVKVFKGKSIADAGSFGQEFAKNMEKEVAEYGTEAFGNTFAHVAEKSRVYTKWIGLVLEGIEKFKGNIMEYQGDLANPRLYEETLIETGISVTKGAVIGSAAAAFVATTIGPGVVAGVTVAALATGAGIVVDYCLDKASKWLFGNDEGWVENVSDTLIDTVHSTTRAVSGFTGMIGKGISILGKGLSILWAT